MLIVSFISIFFIHHAFNIIDREGYDMVLLRSFILFKKDEQKRKEWGGEGRIIDETNMYKSIVYTL